MKQLTKEEKKSLDDLEKNFDKQVEKYRTEKEHLLKEGKKKELEKEFEHLESYLEGLGACACGDIECLHGCGHPKCKNSGPISDTLTNVQFCAAKFQVLKDLLRKK